MMNQFLQPYKPIQVLNNQLNPYIQYSKSIPTGDLSQYVECFWELSTKKSLPQSTSLSILPDGCADIVFDLQHKKIAKSWVSGTMSTLSTIRINNSSHFFGVRFWPGKLYDFLNTPMKTFNKKDIAAYRILPETKKLNQQITAVDSFAKRIKLVETYLNHRIQSEMHPNSSLDNLIQDVLLQQGRISISAMAVKHKISDRQLRRLFEVYIGISPKTFARTIRFQYLLSDVLQAKKGSSIHQALRYGYYDQPHLINDLKVICHKTPQDFADFIGI